MSKKRKAPAMFPQSPLSIVGSFGTNPCPRTTSQYRASRTTSQHRASRIGRQAACARSVPDTA
eukprot:466877-Rhodomonas_salina.2